MSTTWRPDRQIGVGDVQISPRERRYVNDVLQSHRLSYGPFSRRFEAHFARAHQTRHAILTNSGTSALHVAILALKEKYGWADGDEVIIPGVTFVATANTVLMSGLRPVAVDVDPRTYNIVPAAIEEALTLRTRAVIPVHLCGLPADMPSVMATCQRHNLRVVEDSCETMFARVGGQPVGSFGDVACFSTYSAHVLSTGVGGIAATGDDELALIMRSLCNHGRDEIYLAIDDDADISGAALATVMRKRFAFVRLGFSYRITELEAAIGLAQLERRHELLAARASNAAFLAAGMSGLQDAGLLQLPHIPPDTEHTFMVFPLVLTAPGGHRDELTLFLEQAGIETRPLMPLVNQPLYADRFGDARTRLPTSHWLNERAFYLGCHQGLGRRELEYLLHQVHAFFQRGDHK